MLTILVDEMGIHKVRLGRLLASGVIVSGVHELTNIEKLVDAEFMEGLIIAVLTATPS